MERLAALHGKYAEMLRLRSARDACDKACPRRDLAALASRFPGSLREIDELPLAEIRERMRALADALRDPAREAPWMTAVAMFHELTRGALCAKRWLAGRKTIVAATRASFEADAAALTYAEDALAWANELSRVANPPRGRVTELVYARIAVALSVTDEEARTLVFRSSRQPPSTPSRRGR